METNQENAISCVRLESEESAALLIVIGQFLWFPQWEVPTCWEGKTSKPPQKGKAASGIMACHRSNKSCTVHSQIKQPLLPFYITIHQFLREGKWRVTLHTSSSVSAIDMNYTVYEPLSVTKIIKQIHNNEPNGGHTQLN
jgi:hypothetical protein